MAWSCFGDGMEYTGTLKRSKHLVLQDDGGYVINFNEEELKIIQDFKRGNDYIEVYCGTTNKKYGDFAGRLRINWKGQFLITCQCCSECTLGKFFTLIFSI